MKITNEQLRAIQESDVNKVKLDKSTGDFSELLTRHLDSGQAQGSMAPSTHVTPAQATTIDLPGMLSNSTLPVAPFSEHAAEKMSGMFSTFERYAERIGQGADGNLREAFGILQEVSGQIAGFKSEFPNAGEDMPEMAALLNELDVLTTTETFKFNRGDYL